MNFDSPAISANYTHIETSALKKSADSMPDILTDKQDDKENT